MTSESTGLAPGLQGRLRRWPGALALGWVALLGACGGGGGGDATAPPPPVAQRQVSVQISSTVAAGETFTFNLGGQSLGVTQGGSATAFAAAVAEGSSYTVTQTAGPRSCNGSANRSGTVGTANITVIFDCGSPPGSSTLAGQWHAPVGAQVTLRLNGGAGPALTMPPFAGSTDLYNLLPFGFTQGLQDGAAYQVTVASAAANLSCSVYKGATGTMPAAADALRVGCELTHDLLSRSTDSSVRGSYFESGAVVIGGAAGAVGSTVLGYGEGRFVAFVSSATGLGGATGGRRQVFWRDRLTGETLLLSASAAGAEGNGDSFAPALSADGLTVVFESHASNLVAGDTNGVRDVFLWSGLNRGAGLKRISVSAAGVQGNSESYEPTVSGDGRVVAFSTGASNLTAGVSGTSTINVVRTDVATGTHTLITANRVGGAGVGGARPALSEDGNRLAFSSFSSQLVAGDGNGLWDIFVYQHDTASLRRVSLTSTGGERNQGTESASRVVTPAISGNGRFVAYATTASNVVPGDTNGAQDVFVVDLDGALGVRRASQAADGTGGNGDSPIGQGERIAISADGAWVAFTTAASNLGVAANTAVLHGMALGENRTFVTGSAGVSPVQMSRSAAYVVYGASLQQDPRFPGSGLFGHFTGLARAWWWYD